MYFYASPLVTNGSIYVSGDNGIMYSFSGTGATNGSTTLGVSILSSAAVASTNNIIYVASENDSVYALSASTGKVLWSYATEGAVESTPSVVNGIVYVGSDDGYVYALEAAGGTGKSAGSLLWKFATVGDAYQNVAVARRYGPGSGRARFGLGCYALKRHYLRVPAHRSNAKVHCLSVINKCC